MERWARTRIQDSTVKAINSWTIRENQASALHHKKFHTLTSLLTLFVFAGALLNSTRIRRSIQIQDSPREGGKRRSRTVFSVRLISLLAQRVVLVIKMMTILGPFTPLHEIIVKELPPMLKISRLHC